MLLDYELKKAGIDPSTLPGYEREVTTHIAVALAVKSGEADAGMCVYSAAKALGLPFVPVAQERYQLAFRKEYAEDPRLAALIDGYPLTRIQRRSCVTWAVTIQKRRGISGRAACDTGLPGS